MLKKGLSAYNILTVVIQIIFLVIVSFSIVYLVASGMNDELDLGPLRAASFNDRIYYSLVHEELISVDDKPFDLSFNLLPEESYYFRSYPGIIDISKLDKVEEVYSFGENNKFLAAKISLTDFNGRVIKEVFYNKERFDRWRPLVWTPFYSEYDYSYPVLVVGHEESYQNTISKIDKLIDSVKGVDDRVMLLVTEVGKKDSSGTLLDFNARDKEYLLTPFEDNDFKSMAIMLKQFGESEPICEPSEYVAGGERLLTYDRFLTTCENSFTYHRCDVNGIDVIVSYCGLEDGKLKFNVQSTPIDEYLNELSKQKEDLLIRSGLEFDSLQMNIEVIVS